MEEEEEEEVATKSGRERGRRTVKMYGFFGGEIVGPTSFTVRPRG